jgi:cell division inhibitor SulA
VDGADSAVGECFGIKVCGVNGAAFVPQTDRVLAGHFVSPEELNIVVRRRQNNSNRPRCGTLVCRMRRMPLPAFANVAHSRRGRRPLNAWNACREGLLFGPVSSGYSMLDAELPGHGWPKSSLTELLWTQEGCGELRLLAPVLSAVSKGGRPLIFLSPPHNLFAPALAKMGINIDEIVFLNAEKPSDRLWAAEQVLRSSCVGALICWLPAARPEHLRRLQVAASSCDGTMSAFRHMFILYSAAQGTRWITIELYSAGTDLDVRTYRRSL